MNKKNSLFYVLLLCAFVNVSAQNSREFIRNKIQEWGECKNVAITKYNGDLALYGKNGWGGTGLPTDLSDALHEINRDDDAINDVQITENGDWLVLIDNNGFQWNNIPYSLEYKLREFNERKDVVTSVTFNDAGDWILISQEYYVASETWIQDWLKAGADKFGQLWAACVTSDAMVACYSGGYKFYGNVPEDLKIALKQTNMDVSRIKIAGTAWFFGDGKGRYQYNM